MTQTSFTTNPSAARVDDDHAFALAAGLRWWASKGMSEARVILDSPCFIITDPLPPPAPALLPDGLRTPAEAARKLRCSIKTLRAHVAASDLRYVIIGKGTKRPRIRFAPADLDEFITNQTRKDVACPPTSPKTAARRISTTTSKCEVIGFTARRNARRGAKPKK